MRVSEMSDRHLMNTIRMLWLKHDANVLKAGGQIGMLQGEMAIMCAEQEFDAMLETTPAETWPIYDDLEMEAVARGLMK